MPTAVQSTPSPAHQKLQDRTAAKDMFVVPKAEETIHEQLLALRKRLAHLKKEGVYTLEDVEHLSTDVGKVIGDLRDVREDEDGAGMNRNHIDEILDDVWTGLFTLWASVANVDQMLYPLLVKFTAIKRQLDDMETSGAFTEDDVLEIQEALTDIESRHVQDGKFFFNPAKFPDHGNPPSGQGLLFVLLNRCRREARNLLLETDTIESYMLKGTMADLVQVEREVREIQKRGSYSLQQVQALQERAREIDSKRTGGVFHDPDGSIPAGQARITAVLERVFDDLHGLVIAKEEVTGPLRPIYEKLVELKIQLEKMLRNKRWTTTYADLDPLRQALREIDELRSPDGKITRDDGHGGPVEIPSGQAVVHQLLARCYHCVGMLTRSIEAIAPDLEGIYNHLVEARTALLELAKKVRAKETVELSAVETLQTTLSEIESHRRADGTFHTQKMDERSGRIPRGQAVITSLVAECHDLLEESDLLNWINDLLKLNITRVEQCGNGAIHCQLFDTIYGDVQMSKVKFDAKAEHEFVGNFKILQNCFDRHRIPNAIPVDRLVRCKFQDNIEFLQWVKKYWDDHYQPNSSYDPVKRRSGRSVAPAVAMVPTVMRKAVAGTWVQQGGLGTVELAKEGEVATAEMTAGPTSKIRAGNRRPTKSVSPKAATGHSPPGASAPSAASHRHNASSGASTSTSASALQAENSALRTQLVALTAQLDVATRERDFYYDKLREIEVVMGGGDDDGVPHEVPSTLEAMKDVVLGVLYRTEDGFEAPEEDPAESKGGLVGADL
ncbi:hypothetical protein HDU93_009528 [Gonapodya sp. JEL0774]|nr:hypothetical protein HDU93_009528 [Gonapodya sp. JEL0774]